MESTEQGGRGAVRLQTFKPAQHRQLCLIIFFKTGYAFKLLAAPLQVTTMVQSRTW